jgi:hypothetical protein
MWLNNHICPIIKEDRQKIDIRINIFTYILVELIAFFLCMNIMFSPGSLQQMLGWENVDTFMRVRESSPMDIVINMEQYVL